MAVREIVAPPSHLGAFDLPDLELCHVRPLSLLVPLNLLKLNL